MENLQQELQTLCNCIDMRKFFILYKDESSGPKTRPEIQQKAAELFGITVEELKSKTRKGEVVKARQLCMWYEKLNTKHSLASIGFEYGGKDHATVLHAHKAIENMIETKDEKYYKAIVEFIKFTEK